MLNYITNNKIQERLIQLRNHPYSWTFAQKVGVDLGDFNLHTHFRALTCLIAVFWFAGWPAAGRAPAKNENAHPINKPIPASGIIDLTAHDFSAGTKVKLTDNWEFFWKAFISPGNTLAKSEKTASLPHNWDGQIFENEKNKGTGFATYRLTVLLPANAPPLALSSRGLSYASHIYANGVLIQAKGKPGAQRADEIPQSYGMVSLLPSPSIVDNTSLPLTTKNAPNEIELIIHLSNYFHAKGGVAEPLVIGNAKAMMLLDNQKNLALRMMIGVMLALTLYHLVLFAARPAERVPLQFAAYMSAVLVYIVVSNNVLSMIGYDVPASLLLRLEYFSLIIGAYFVLQFMWGLYPQLRLPKINMVFSVYVAVFSCIALLFPARLYTLLLPLFQLGVLTAVTIALAIVLTAIKEKLPHARVLLLACLGILIGTVYGVLTHKAGGSGPDNAIYLSVCFFILTQAVVIGRQAALATETLEKLREKLQNTNFQLETRVAERTKELQASVKKANTANQAKTDFLSMMSHELRTPMNAVLGSAQSLKHQALPQAASDLVNTLSDAGEILMTLLNDILDLAKIEAGKLEIEESDVDLRELLGGVERMYRPQIDDKGLSFSLNIEDDVPQLVRGDTTRIRQIIFNLVSNAVKFTTEGSVSIQTKALTTNANRIALCITVSDTGIGIDKKARKKLFKQFEQAEKSTSRRFGGTGLGLAISKELAALMGGDLTLDPKTGVGSSFTLHLDVEIAAQKTAAPKSNKPAAETKSMRRNLRILAAEDNMMNRQVLTAFLASFKQTTEYADNGQQALDMLACKAFDLVLMDIQMPIMDGVSAVKALRADKNGLNTNVPVVAMTANTMSGDRERYLDAGMDGFVPKPMDIRVLYTEMVRATEKKRTRAFAAKLKKPRAKRRA